jgi:hypothetical protein
MMANSRIAIYASVHDVDRRSCSAHFQQAVEPRTFIVLAGQPLFAHGLTRITEQSSRNCPRPPKVAPTTPTHLARTLGHLPRARRHFPALCRTSGVSHDLARICRGAELWGWGTSPSQAVNCRAERKCAGSPILATRAVAVIGPTPGTIARRWLVSFARCQASRSRSSRSILSSSARSCSANRPSTSREGRQTLLRRFGQHGTEFCHVGAALRDHDTELRQEPAQGVHQHRSLADEESACPMKHQRHLAEHRIDLALRVPRVDKQSVPTYCSGTRVAFV